MAVLILSRYPSVAYQRLVEAQFDRRLALGSMGDPRIARHVGPGKAPTTSGTQPRSRATPRRSNGRRATTADARCRGSVLTRSSTHSPAFRMVTTANAIQQRTLQLLKRITV